MLREEQAWENEGMTQDELLQREMEVTVEARRVAAEERRLGIHYVLFRLGFTFSTFKALDKEGRQLAVVFGSIVHNELASIAQHYGILNPRKVYQNATLVTLIQLGALGISLNRANVDVWDLGHTFQFRTKIDLMGFFMRGREKVPVLIELKTTTVSHALAIEQLEHRTNRNNFPDGHPLAPTFVFRDSMTKALVQLFLMYRNYRKKSPTCEPILIYVFSDDVQIYPFFELFPQLRTTYYGVRSDIDDSVDVVALDHIENLYQSVVNWYNLKYGKQLITPEELERIENEE